MFFQAFLGLIISLLVGVTSAGSFKVEKESGALELLLVAPLNQNAIIKDRIKAVWAYYKPLVLTWAAFLWFVAANFPSASYSYSGMIGGTVLSTFLSMYTLPLAGLYFALRLKSYLGILLATLLAGAILPLFGWIWLKGAILFIMYGGARWMSFKGFPLEIAVIATHTYLWRRFYQQVQDRLTGREFE
jgi:hypothetical protein